MKYSLFSVCKKETGGNIETLPSSFSHLYSSNPEDMFDIPRHQQKDILDICGDEISLYLNNKQTTIEARKASEDRQDQTSPSYECY